MKKAKIIATIGPASNNEKTLTALAKQGMDVCRLNFSFGTHEEHEETIARIRKVSRDTGKAIAILQDLQGPKIRVGKLSAPVTITEGDTVILSGNKKQQDMFYLPTTYSKIAEDTKKGKSIRLSDGAIELVVTGTDVENKEVHCKVVMGGTIVTGKGINLPYTNISLPSLTAKDKKDALFGAQAGVDYIALSFVRSAKDIDGLHKLLRKNGFDIPVIAKIEKPEALDNLEEILDVAEGVMVARGDLGVEVSFARVPIAQKMILNRANEKGKVTIIATQMLASMVNATLPTRAEATDVANGIIDGADAVMLSNETATGNYPEKAVAAMAEIIMETESALGDETHHNELDVTGESALREAICSAASYLSYTLDERAMAVFTKTGNTARILSKVRPDTNIYVLTFDERLYHRMPLYYNVYPIYIAREDAPSDADETDMTDVFVAALKERKIVKKGDKLICLTGTPSQTAITTDTIRVEIVH